MKTSRIFLFSMVAAAAISCKSNDSARIKLTIADSPAEELVIKAQDINKYTVLDTLQTDEAGRMKYKVAVKKGDPEFFYIYRNNVRVASLLLSAGDKVNVTTDSLGHFSVEGSAVSQQIADFLSEQAKVDKEFSSIVDKVSEDNVKELRASFNRKFITHYRNSLKFAMNNSKSLVVIPVLYQKIQKDVPVFGSLNDALIFKSISDSLKTVYPDSRYVKALEAEAQSRLGNMEMAHRLSEAEAVGFPDLILQNQKLETVKLSEVKADCILLHFWNPMDPVQKMFNQEVLKPLYRDFHQKGLEIYAVGMTGDRTSWDLAVENQQLPWINVCDLNAGAGSSAILYNLQSLPTTFFISNGTLVDETPEADLNSMRKLIRKLLK